MLSQDKIELVDTDGAFKYSSSGAGNFFNYNPTTKYYFKNGEYNFFVHCRESFEYWWNILITNYFKMNPSPVTNYIGFHYEGLNIKELNKFWEDIENKLGLSEKTIFHPTDFKTVTIIKVAPWWIESATKRQFFSLLLRAGAVHNVGGDFDKAIDRYPLAKSIKFAVDWFMQGNTHNRIELANHTRGIHYVFSQLSKEATKERLVKPGAV